MVVVTGGTYEDEVSDVDGVTVDLDKEFLTLLPSIQDDPTNVAVTALATIASEYAEEGLETTIEAANEATCGSVWAQRYQPIPNHPLYCSRFRYWC